MRWFAVAFLLGKFRLAGYVVECIVSLAQCGIILRGIGVNVTYENIRRAAHDSKPPFCWLLKLKANVNIIEPSLDSFEHNPVKLSKKNMTASRIKQFYKTMT